MDRKTKAERVKLIVGLGNPEPAYAVTRHNIGKTVVNAFVARHDGSWNAGRAAHKANLAMGGIPLLIVKLACYMNDSGPQVTALAGQNNIASRDIIIVYDDLDLPLGSVRVRKNTSSGGHNGVASIIEFFGSSDFVRVRVGIGPKRGEAKDYVLRSWPKSQQKLVTGAIRRACDALDYYLEHGLEKTAAEFS